MGWRSVTVICRGVHAMEGFCSTLPCEYGVEATSCKDAMTSESYVVAGATCNLSTWGTESLRHRSSMQFQRMTMGVLALEASLRVVFARRIVAPVTPWI